MPAVRDILRKKGDRVFYVDASATVLEATRLMNQHGIGAVVVLEQDRVAGIFTERDVLRRVVAQEQVPSQVRVREVMTRQVVCCSPETRLDEARSVMKHRRIRHLPVVNGDGSLAGIVSIGDLNAFDADSQETTIHLLHEYLYGRT